MTVLLFFLYLEKNISTLNLLSVKFPGCHIAGLELALSSMKKNEKSRFMIKPKYAYGAMGCPPRIPADSTGSVMLSLFYATQLFLQVISISVYS